MGKYAIRILIAVLPLISKEFKNILPDVLNSLEQKAKATSNPVDDVFVMILRSLLEG